jgi:hypothetical protein
MFEPAKAQTEADRNWWAGAVFASPRAIQDRRREAIASLNSVPARGAGPAQIANPLDERMGKVRTRPVVTPEDACTGALHQPVQGNFFRSQS